ncbi:hypothetical protein KFL_005890080 [Klebsormidium nitens]|uniref:Uncharacterized protein n=1 Tax=Klebsormidium nitens TaxID=105231 RepID=A0A1Y1IH73_KLENI|nr:hypothetical protein KFL_005890080 [Klebsormidium nitens]|eukprot:GAQ90013.1 hypothetical protein KFL_005890080 [Klebsormidium nitens]
MFLLEERLLEVECWGFLQTAELGAERTLPFEAGFEKLSLVYMGGGPSRGSSDESASSLEDPSSDSVLVVRMNRQGRDGLYHNQGYNYGYRGGAAYPNVSSRRTS